MKDTICKQVRFEIDEAELSTALSSAAKEHLKTCGECKEFHSKETKLRQIIGSLEPVNAPADFDFRLRARLANDRHYSASPLRLLRSRSFAVAAMLLIFAATVLMIRQASRQNPVRDTTTASTSSGDQSSRPLVQPVISKQQTSQETKSTVTVTDINKRNPLSATSPVAKRRSVVSIDFSATTAPVIRSEQSMATMATFPLDVSQQSFKVSLDDAHGTSKTILVPTVSFGAGRALTGTAPVSQYAPKGDW